MHSLQIFISEQADTRYWISPWCFRLATSLYIPFTDFIINDKDGQRLLYENLVQSGPAYKLIVHESPAWLDIKEKMFWHEAIQIISNKKAEEYKEIVYRFFSPITEAIPYYMIGSKRYPTANLTTDLRRALSYILIAHDYKTRIYEDDILKYDFMLSELLKKHKNVFPEEGISRVEFVENLIKGYQIDSIPTLSVNKDPRIFNDLMKLLDKEEVIRLSEKNYLFGVLKVKKDLLKREIQQLVTQIVKNEWFPYVAQATGLALSYYPDLSTVEKFLGFLAGLGAKILSKYDFREYAPPIQSPRILELEKNSKGMNFFSYTPFNYEVKLFVPVPELKIKIPSP